MADRVIEAAMLKQELKEIKSNTVQLVAMLRYGARVGGDLYDRPTGVIVYETEQVLERALTLAQKCRNQSLMRRPIHTTAFSKMRYQLESSIADVTWLFRISDPTADANLSLPPVIHNDPVMSCIWQFIAMLSTGSIVNRADAAEWLLSLAIDSTRYRKLIIKEGGVVPEGNFAKSL